MGEPKFRIKLLIDTNTKRVLFAEADEDCVDFLLSILSLPVSSLVRLLANQQTILGSVSNLYGSIDTLMSESHFQPTVTKDTLLPKTTHHPLLKLPISVPHEFFAASSTEKKLYRYSCVCGYGCFHNDTYCSKYVLDNEICPICNRVLSRDVSNSGGFVKEATYMVMDDLVVKPMSMISSITLFAHFDIKNVYALEEKVVNFGTNEAMKLLKASLVSNNVLTSVFC